MGGGGSKSKIHESSQATERVRAQEQARVRMAQEKEATERSRLKYQEQERIRQMKQQQYNKAHQMKMQQMKDDRARQEREAAALNEKRRREHDARMKQMQIEKEERDKQRKKQLLTARINSCNDEISKLGTMITNDTNQLKKDKPVLEKVSQDLKVVEKWVENFRDHKNTKLDNYAGNIRLAEAKDEFDKADFMVQKHIDKTGQIESKVGEFLDLFSLLVKATISTTAQSNILDAEISTMGELIRKECQDQLSIDNYFNQKNLTRFIPILADEGFVNVNALICESDEEYDEILQLLEKGIQKQIELGQNKMENNQEEKQEEEKEEISGEILAKELLTKWRLIKYWDVIQDEGFEDPKYWKEITDNDLNEMGFKRGHRIKFKAEIKEWISGNKILTTMEKRLLNEICFKHESWQRYEKEQADAVKEGLDDISSLLGEFFMRIHTAIKQSRAILNYEIDLNDQQCKAIKMVNNLPPAIEYKDNNIINDIDEYDVKDNDEFIQPDICDDIRKEWIINSKCEIYCESHKKWCDGVIIDITNDDEGEWLQVKYCVTNRLYKTKEIQRSSQGIRVSMYNMDKNKKLALQCRALTTASLISIDVTDSMMNKFNTNVLTTRALAVARGVEDCCMQMIQAQSTIRQSVLLSQEVLKHKPAYMSGEAERLWKAACDGSKRIVKTAITMIRVSAQYFGFFLRFQQSFKFYQSRKHCSLLVSLEHLHKDVREFTQFQHNFAKHVQELSKEAMDCIQNCIESGAGAENFENWRNKRDITLQTYQNKKAQYDKKSLELDHQFDVEQQKRINLCAEKEKFDYKVKTLETAIINNNDYKQKYLNLLGVDEVSEVTYANQNTKDNNIDQTEENNMDTDSAQTDTNTIRNALISTEKLLNLANQLGSNEEFQKELSINSNLIVEYTTEAKDSSSTKSNHSGESKHNSDDENGDNSNDDSSHHGNNNNNDDDHDEKDNSNQNQDHKCTMHKYDCNVSWHAVKLKQLEEENRRLKLLLQKQTTINDETISQLYDNAVNLQEIENINSVNTTTNFKVTRKLAKKIIPNNTDELFCNVYDYMNKYFRMHNDLIEDYKSEEKDVKVINCGIQCKATKETLYIVCEKENKSNPSNILWKTNDDLYSASRLEQIYKISKDTLSPSVTISDKTIAAINNAKEHLTHILKNEKQRNVMIGSKNTPWNNEEKIPVFNKATKQTGLTLMLEKHEFVQKLKTFANNINDIKLIPIVRFNNENKYFYEVAWIVEIGKDINVAISFKHIKNKYLPSAIFLDIHDAHKLAAYKHNCDCLTNFNCFIDRLQIGENKQMRMYQRYKRKIEQKVNEQKNQIDQHENQMQDYLRLRAQDILIIDDMKLTCENLQRDLQSLLQLQCSVNQQQQTCNRLHELNTLHTLNLNSQTIPSNPFQVYSNQLTTQFNNLNLNQQQ